MAYWKKKEFNIEYAKCCLNCGRAAIFFKKNSRIVCGADDDAPDVKFNMVCEHYLKRKDEDIKDTIDLIEKNN